MRAVLDTNVIVSRYLSPQGTPAQVLQKWEDEAFTLLLSHPILDEYKTVLGYERLRKLHHLNDEEIEGIVAHFESFAELVEVEGTLEVVTADPDDDKFLECAATGGADYLVTGDSHLLNLSSYQSVAILDPASFLRLLNSQ